MRVPLIRIASKKSKKMLILLEWKTWMLFTPKQKKCTIYLLPFFQELMRYARVRPSVNQLEFLWFDWELTKKNKKVTTHPWSTPQEIPPTQLWKDSLYSLLVKVWGCGLKVCWNSLRKQTRVTTPVWWFLLECFGGDRFPQINRQFAPLKIRIHVYIVYNLYNIHGWDVCPLRTDLSSQKEMMAVFQPWKL